jgi:peptide/nickel transport system permease protein
MAAYLVRRGLYFVFILFGVSVVVFLAMRMVPGDPVIHLAGPFATERQRQQIRESYGLDRPLVVQYGKWLTKAVQGDLGRSMQLHIPVVTLLATKLKNSLILLAGSMAISIAVGWGLGILAGFRPGGMLDRVALGIGLFGISLPAFWLGMVLAITFAIKLQWFPAAGLMSERGGGGGVGDILWHAVLPSLSAAALPAGIMIRMVRATILETRGLTFATALAARGLSASRVARHVIRNAFPTILNVTGMMAGFLLTGAIFSEVVFSWPGLGLQIYTAVTARDYTVAQGAVLFVCVIFVLLNAFIDFLRPLFDPRIRLV